MPLQPSRHKQKLSITRFDAIGTVWEIELFDAEMPAEIYEKVQARIEIFDAHYSRFRSDSLVTKMSLKTGVYTLPEDAKPLFDLYELLYELTGGLMTPLIGQTLSEAGYDAAYSFVPRTVHKTPQWKDCIKYNFPQLTILKPVLLDVGACGKGYLVDIIAELLQKNGVKSFVINAGGDIMCHVTKNIEVGLENPFNEEQAIGVCAINNQALCGSAGYRRAWHGYTHIMNPANPQAKQPYAAVWVTAKSTLLADALTTALYFTDKAELKQQFDFEYALVASDGALEYSTNFPAEFFK